MDRALAATAAVTGLALKTLSARAQILARLGRHDEAARDADQVQEWADRLDDPAMGATATHDRGLVAMAAGRYAEAAELIGEALAAGAGVSRVSAGLSRAEALALSGDPDGATAAAAQVAARTGRTVRPGLGAGAPGRLVQALVAHARGDLAETRRRLDESAESWRRVSARADEEAGDGYLASLVDLGRPPIVGLVEPARELARIAAYAALLDPEPAAR